MNCPNCGAAMRLVENRGYFVCDFCTTFHFPTSEPQTRDGVLSLGEIAVDVLCPVCQKPLELARVGGVSAMHCRRCHGILMERVALNTVVQSLRARSGNVMAARTPIDPAELQRHLRCPRCHALMDVHPYLGPGAVVIDTCPDCHGVWLDHGELAEMVDAPGPR